MNCYHFKLINFNTFSFNRLKRVQRTVSHGVLGNLGVSERDLRNTSYYVSNFLIPLLPTLKLPTSPLG